MAKNPKKVGGDLLGLLREHLFKVLLSAVVSLGGTLGLLILNSVKSDSQSIKNDLNALQCRVAEFGARNEFNAMQLRLVVTPLDSIKINSEYITGLDNVVVGYRKTLEYCDEGKEFLAQLVAYQRGLNAYVNHDWDEAILQFASISRRTALTEKSLANAWLHKYETWKLANEPRQGEARQKASAHLKNASDLATKESDYAVKQRSVAYLRCNQQIAFDSTDEAFACLNKLIKDGLGSATVYYNLASLHAVRGNFEAALAQMAVCINEDAGQNFVRSEVEADPDFKGLLADPKYGPKFRELLLKIPL